MISYHNPIIENNLTISIDNVVLDVWVANPATRDMIENRLFSMAKKDVALITWEGNKRGTFRKQYLVKKENSTSFWIGHGLIGTSIMAERYRLEFNPNKVGSDPHFVAIHELLVHNCRKPTNYPRIPSPVSVTASIARWRAPRKRPSVQCTSSSPSWRRAITWLIAISPLLSGCRPVWKCISSPTFRPRPCPGIRE